MATLLEEELVMRLMIITLEGIVAQYEKATDPLEKEVIAEKYLEVFQKYLDTSRKFTNSKQ